MKTIIHVNQHNIKANSKGEDRPVLTCKTYKSNNYSNEAIIHGCDVLPAARVIYSPEKPLSCGAKVWVETENKVTYPRSSDIDNFPDMDDLGEEKIIDRLLEDYRKFVIIDVEVLVERGEDGKPIFKKEGPTYQMYGPPMDEETLSEVDDEAIKIAKSVFDEVYESYVIEMLYKICYDSDGYRSWNYLEFTGEYTITRFNYETDETIETFEINDLWEGI